MRGGVDTTQVMTETVEDKVSHSITGLDILKGIVAAGTVISGTVATQTKVFTNESAVLEKTVGENGCFGNKWYSSSRYDIYK
ncbi:cell wall surface anchored protein [Streptococcus pneumoniae]|nr:cell wall surface anchored protein [Streptococcus pneumoniae]